MNALARRAQRALLLLSAALLATLTACAGTPSAPGVPVRLTATLLTASGKAIAPEDLLVTQTRKVHLLIADRGLTDYQHIHPIPGHEPGQWVFEFTPKVAMS